MKGFTLIELLAVIVILAIILLISMPLIADVIDNVKKGAFESSVKFMIKAAENTYMEYAVTGGIESNIVYEYEDGSLISSDELAISGDAPKNGTIVIRTDGKVALAVDNGSFCAKKDYLDDSISIEPLSEVECILDSEVVVDIIEFDSVKGVNRPVLSTGMTPIKWDGSNNEIATTVDDPEWYDYTAKKWANVKTADGSYWVWIPRYAYKITGEFHTSTAGSIDIKFLKGNTNSASDNSVIETSGYEALVKDTSSNYFLHPAFQFSKEELGFWMAKYEATPAEGSASGISSCSSQDNVTTKVVKIIPNATPWRCITISNANTAIRNMVSNNVYGWNSLEVDAHLTKNTEWGAVAYLSKSVYGSFEAEIYNNAFNQYRTGCSGSFTSTSNSSTCLSYETANGVLASTTSNIYGIYDMSGGSSEFVAAYLNNGHASLTTYGSSLLNEPNSNYKNLFLVGSNQYSSSSNYDANINSYGDAIFETSSTGDSTSGAWHGDYSSLSSGSTPFITRGGHWNFSYNSGIYSFIYSEGRNTSSTSFRPVVFIK